MAPESDDWSELWATFSVKDHTRAETFVAEVLLYDKLLIPVVPMREDGLSPEDADREWKRWEDARWDPARQTQLLAILNPGPADDPRNRAEVIPWTAERQAEWQQAMASAFRQARHDGYFVTGSCLERFAPVMARTVVAVPQYSSLKELQASEHVLRRQDPYRLLPGQTLLSVLGFELLVPATPDRDDFQPFVDAVQVSRDPAYRDARRALFQWQRRFLHAGQTDVRSIRAAVDEMHELVMQVQKATASQRLWKGLKRFFSFVGAASKVAALAGPPAAVAAAGGAAVAAVGSFVAELPTAAANIPAATLIADARERLGIT